MMKAPILDPNNRSINQWADLHKDILFGIIKYLDLKTDLPRIRGVCPAWRSALPLAEFPMHKSHSIEVPSLGEGENLPLFLRESMFYFFSPLSPSADGIDSSCWMARMFETGVNKWHLINHRPYMITEPPITGEINLLDCRVSELARPMTLAQMVDNKLKVISKKVVGKWDLTSSNLSMGLVQLVKKKGDGLLMLKSGDQKWVKIDETTKEEKLKNASFQVLDIAFHGGKFYFFQKNCDTQEWRIGIINPVDCSISLQFKSGSSPLLREPYYSGYLVPSPSNDCLYLLLEDPKDVYFVTRINEEQEHDGLEWEPVENIGDELFLIGDCVSFTLNRSALDAINPQWKSISMCRFSSVDFEDSYYQVPEGENCLKHVESWFYTKYFKYFLMKDYSLLLNKMSEGDEEVYNRLFFPPPAWIKWCCPSVDNVEVKLDFLRIPVYYDDDYCCGCDGSSESD